MHSLCYITSFYEHLLKEEEKMKFLMKHTHEKKRKM